MEEEPDILASKLVSPRNILLARNGACSITQFADPDFIMLVAVFALKTARMACLISAFPARSKATAEVLESH